MASTLAAACFTGTSRPARTRVPRVGVGGAARRPPMFSSATPRTRRPHPLPPRAVGAGGPDGDGDNAGADPSPPPSSEPADIAAARARLALAASTSGASISGPQLRAAVFDKWGRDYAVLLARRGPRIFFQVLWKHAEQASYPLSEDDHAATYDAVASYLTDWGAGGTVRAGIRAATRRGPGYTGGGAARAISIPLDVDLSSARGAEFL